MSDKAKFGLICGTIYFFVGLFILLVLYPKWSWGSDKIGLMDWLVTSFTYLDLPARFVTSDLVYRYHAEAPLLIVLFHLSVGFLSWFIIGYILAFWKNLIFKKSSNV